LVLSAISIIGWFECFSFLFTIYVFFYFSQKSLPFVVMTDTTNELNTADFIEKYEQQLRRLEDRLASSNHRSPAAVGFGKRNFLNRSEIVSCLLRCGYGEETLISLTNYKSALEFELSVLKYVGPMNAFVINKELDRLRMKKMTPTMEEVRDRILLLAKKRNSEFEQRKDRWVSKDGDADLD
jgi:hypothetical protein